MASSNSNQTPTSDENTRWEDGSLRPFLRHYFRIDDRPEYDYDSEIHRARTLLEQVQRIGHSEQATHSFVYAIANGAVQPQRLLGADSLESYEAMLVAFVLLFHHERFGGFYLPPRIPANQAAAEYEANGLGVIQYPPWPHYQGPPASTGRGRSGARGRGRGRGGPLPPTGPPGGFQGHVAPQSPYLQSLPPNPARGGPGEERRTG